MTPDEIKHDLLQVCKVKGWDSDINLVGFHVLCDKLKQLGVDEEREACAKMCDYVYDYIVTDGHIKDMAFKIRARAQA